VEACYGTGCVAWVGDADRRGGGELKGGQGHDRSNLKLNLGNKLTVEIVTKCHW
jgi:hypothetical protein